LADHDGTSVRFASTTGSAVPMISRPPLSRVDHVNAAGWITLPHSAPSALRRHDAAGRQASVTGVLLGSSSGWIGRKNSSGQGLP
jgi:hypothetical protein